MKKAIVLLATILMSTYLFSQEKDSLDKVNRIMLNYLKSIDVESGAIRDLLISQADSILEKTTDIELTRKTNQFIDNLRMVEFADFKAKPLSAADGQLVSKFNVKEDKFKGLTFITHKKASNFYPYIGLGKDIIYLRLVNKYNGDDWIFFDKVTLLIDDKKFEYEISAPNRDVGGSGKVYEKSDKMVDKILLDMLDYLSSSNGEIEYRMSGKYYVDNKFSKRDYQVFVDTMDLFNSLVME